MKTIKMTRFFLLLSIFAFNNCANSSNPHPKSTMTSTEQTKPNATEKNYQTAYLGGGCFWCMEAVYKELNGVITVESGYAGGKTTNPTYKEVCTGSTGHAEIIKITFDPSIITYQDIIDIFWHVHNPTTLNQQGNDQGTQYRSVIFYQGDLEKQIAEKSMLEAQIQKVWPDPIVTQIVPLDKFYVAEDYHQDYFANNPNQGYCVYVVSPKVEKFRKEFKEKLKQ
jgi:peptide-methionine (S)-S-oxide reductase